MGVHLSRLGEELVLWSTTEFGFVQLGEGYCSGSSLMPQKRNPDIAELLRGKPARVIGDVVALLTISKGLTLAYNKDLQETQEPLYDAVETARLVAGGDAGPDRRAWSSTSRACAPPPHDPALGATDLAEELVRGGMPFRTRARGGRQAGPPRRGAAGLAARARPPPTCPRSTPELTPARAGRAGPRARRRRAHAAGRARADAVLHEVARLEAELARSASRSSASTDA